MQVPASASGERLDAFVAHATTLSRSRGRQLIDDGSVTLDGKAARASVRLSGGETVVVRVPAPAPAALVPQDLPLAVLFEDDDVLVIDKPAGMAVHPGAGIADGTVANAVLFRCPGVSISGERRPGIVHRLDKDTTGVLVVAKHDGAQQALSRAFAERAVDKRYAAFCLGRLSSTSVEWITGHRRADGDRRRFTTRLPPPVREGGAVRRAHTVAHVLACAGGASALDVALLTGRTHQIRAHLADAGHPLLQDQLYGGGHIERRLPPGPVRDATARLHRQALHARRIEFPHPRSGARVVVEAPLPPDLAVIDRAIREGA
ncbi:MAG: RluA family pseudouridine synthase [Deltaproteobacteria bacterium]|nr:RluA family pseudouridine synthase [Deltaproteobacteria bacterium]